MTRALRRRIDGIESRFDDMVTNACATCRFWCGTVLRDDAGNMSRPETCPDCGRDVPIFRLLHIVGVPLELL
jgi:hypothetical protein